ncbi:hypothetical protein WT71_14535 [Burkholderia stagnalis]|nr:hypothetical protein WT71_14535 [Burkholderia stagnalis]KWI71750.1 hypothetical protein WT73_13955 [Burkholderia stagnalis]
MRFCGIQVIVKRVFEGVHEFKHALSFIVREPMAAFYILIASFPKAIKWEKFSGHLHRQSRRRVGFLDLTDAATIGFIGNRR